MIAYRDGFSAAYQRFEERRAALLQRGCPFARLRSASPATVAAHRALRRELEQAAPADLDDVAGAEALCDRFERSFADLDNLERQLEAARIRRRLPGDGRTIAAALVITALLGGAAALSQDAQGDVPAGPTPPAAPVSTDACAGTMECLWAGRCTREGDVCVARSDAACRASYGCERHGRCALDGQRCIAAGDADCAGSLVCARADQCTAVDGACVRVSRSAE